jgi:hypothetical protein
MDVFSLVYRCAIIVKPQKAFLDWVNKIGPMEDMSLSKLQEDSHVYLVPDFEEEDQIEKAIEKYIKLNYAGIFLNELSGWYLDKSAYPALTYATFLNWFEISMHTMIFDMVNQPILKEE